MLTDILLYFVLISLCFIGARLGLIVLLLEQIADNTESNKTKKQ